jgi:hypothetical protein
VYTTYTWKWLIVVPDRGKPGLPVPAGTLQLFLSGIRFLAIPAVETTTAYGRLLMLVNDRCRL